MSTRNMILWISGILILFVYFVNLGVNDIWNPNEGFYADAIREMFKRGNIFDFFFNHNHRFNKPPVTYWSIGISVLIFGMNEWAIRLPMILFAIGTVIYTYKTGKRVYNEKVGFWAAIATALSPLFLSNTRYATPEIPLAFFFTFTMYLFIKAYQEKSLKHWLAFYIAWGFTVLTKGYPYFIVVGGIMAIYLFIEHNFNIRNLFKSLPKYGVYWGFPLAFVLGMSWIAYSYLKFGDDFLRILSMETVERAFTYQSNFFEELFFFPSVVLWGFLPYSFVLFYVAARYLTKLEWIKQHAFGLAWFFVFLIVFTIAKFKLPTYFIQANGGMAILVGYYLAQWKPSTRFNRNFAIICYVIPGILATIVTLYVAYMFKLNFSFYIIAALPVILWIIIKFSNFWILGEEEYSTPIWQYNKIFPFVGLLFLMMIVTWQVMAKVEPLRPYKTIGSIIQKTAPDDEIPLIIQQRFLHNMPYYANRRVIGDIALVDVIDYYFTYDQMLALVKNEDLKYFPEAKVIWNGMLYKRDSEAVFMSFITKHAQYLNGNKAGFENLSLIWLDRTKKPLTAKR